MNPAGTWKNLKDFIDGHRVEKGFEFTHTCLNPSCSFYVPADDLATFYELYELALSNKENLYITEKNRHIGPILIDLDLRFAVPENGEPIRLHTKYIQSIVKIWSDVISKFLDVKPEYKIYVLEKPNPTIYRNNVVKDGIHIIIPNVVTKASVKYLIREEAMIRLEPIMKEMGSINKIEDVVDKAVIEKNNWFMHGSKKVDSPPYDTTYVFTFDGKKSSHSNNKSLVQLFSLRNKNKETAIVEAKKKTVVDFEEKEEETRRNSNISKKIFSTENTTLNKYYENIEQVQELVKILDPSRANNYEDWIRLGWCLRNIDDRLLPAWDEFSKHSNKYDNSICEKMWIKMRDSGLGIGSLHMWAKRDSPAEYTEIMKTDLKTLIYQSMSLTHNDIARVVYQMFQHEFVCSSLRHKTWYEFKKHKWHVSDSGLGLRIKLSEDVWKTYNLESIDYSQKGIAATNKADQDKYIEQAKKLSEISMKLRNSSFKENIMKECSELFYVEKFEEKLDSSTNLIGFENGVYDIETQEFRDGRAEDYLSFSTGNNYVPYNPDHYITQEINRYLEQVLTKRDVREYVLKLFATFITGQIKEQKFYIWTGSGSNSKSKLVELFEKSFGDYCCKFPITLLTQKRVASNAANSELARAKGKRFACLQEPSEDEKINIGLMKELSGGDKIMARALFKEPFEFFPQFKMLLLCNHLPSVPSDDGGTWRRIRVVEFKSKFCENPQEPNEFPIDYDLSSKMEGWREHFFGMLIHYYRKYQTEGITEPMDVLECTMEYKLKNDHMTSFVETHIEKKESGFLTVDEAFADLKDWIKNDNVPIKPGSKNDLEKYLMKVIPSKIVTFNGKKGFKGYRLSSVYGFSNDEDDLDRIAE